MPQITSSVRDSVRPSMITAPSPWGTPVISPTTITNQASPNPSRRPVKIDGVAAGSTTLKNCALPLQPSIEAASNSFGSTERTPKMVLSRIG